MPYCAVFGCTNCNKKTKGTDIRYFTFPKDEEIRLKWIAACGRPGLINVKNACVCSAHFSPESYSRNMKYELIGKPIPTCIRVLKEDAVPDLNTHQGAVDMSEGEGPCKPATTSLGDVRMKDLSTSSVDIKPFGEKVTEKLSNGMSAEFQVNGKVDIDETSCDAKSETSENNSDSSDKDIKSDNNKEVEPINDEHTVIIGENGVEQDDSDDKSLCEVPRKETSATSRKKDKGDDIKITEEVLNDDESDIEMLEESDPLAISDAFVEKAQKEKEKEKEVKKDGNVIIIDTNSLLRSHGSVTTSVATPKTTASEDSHPVIQPKATVPSTHVSVSTATASIPSVVPNINASFQAFAGGLQSQSFHNAYLQAIQQQCYSSLGGLHDDAYVIEAPSFIVPYVMEGKPKETIKSFVESVSKLLEAAEKENKKLGEGALQKGRVGKEKKDNEEKQNIDSEAEKIDSEDKKEKDIEEKGKKDSEEKDGADKEWKYSEEEREEDSEENELMDIVEKEEKDSVEELKNASEKEKDIEKEELKAEEELVDSEEIEEKNSKEKSESVERLLEDGEKTTSEKDDNVEIKKTEEDRKSSSSTESDIEVLEIAKEQPEDFRHLGRWEPYYRSALGKFMLDLGLSQVREFLQGDLLRMQKRKLDKMKTSPSKQDFVSVKILEKQLELTKKKNAHLRLDLKTCKFCSYRTESYIVMERHLESPHMINYTYKCNFCDFETRGPQVVLFHMEAEHNIRGRLERAPAFFQCPLCPYEDNNKSKITRHSFSCAKKFKGEKNCELVDWEPPAKIPKIHKGRPNVLGKPFEPIRVSNLLPKSFTPGVSMNINLQPTLTSGLLNASTISTLQPRGRGRPVGSYKNLSSSTTIKPVSNSNLIYSRGTNALFQQSGTSPITVSSQLLQAGKIQRVLPASTSSVSSVNLIPGLAASSSITIQSVGAKSGNTKSPQQPSISITPLPRPGQSSSTPKTNNSSSGKPSFVICEICDGYIKDLEQLRNHMSLIHKVKIHPKMIYNRPPLNCQKCQQRFFTDQGLERHLLGTHGLVTSSMQEAATKGKDAGRCPICGKVFQWKLLNHVSRDHKMALKPAHLSYKCTVCTATFNMYRLFENHVYSAHSVVQKKGDTSGNKDSGSPKKCVNGSDTPLRINDEITIIPQPSVNSSKPEVKFAKKVEKATVGKEITITKVGARNRKNGSGVEVISLDESPKKTTAILRKQRSTATSRKARSSS